MRRPIWLRDAAVGRTEVLQDLGGDGPLRDLGFIVTGLPIPGRPEAPIGWENHLDG
jgi:hypothetical protein